MFKSPAGVAAFFALACVLLAAPAHSADAPAAPQPPAPDYHPSLGDLMTMAVQPRHIKLGAAGKQHNWPYLAYESSELRNAFSRIGRTIPAYRGNTLSDLFAAQITPALDDLDVAIKAKDAARFNAAYGKVTEACNTCHSALDHAYVVIRAPTISPYADQDFSAR
jgi:hypothetical protein